jgi:AcrR family transcriptional regulator
MSVTALPEREETARERILREAIAVFARRGLKGATTVEIARRAGVAQALVHYHFENKDELFEAAVRHVLAVMRAELAAADRETKDLDPADRIKVMLRRFVHFSARNPHVALLVGHVGDRLAAIDQETEGPSVLAGLWDPLVQLHRAGRLRSGLSLPLLGFAVTSAAAALFQQAAIAKALFEIDVFDPDVVDAHADTVIELVFHGALQEPQPRSRPRRKTSTR